LVIICALRGLLIGLCGSLPTGHPATVVRAVTLGAIAGAAWGIAEPAIARDKENIVFLLRALPLAVIAAVTGSAILRAPRVR
jgi:hypothetical protein